MMSQRTNNFNAGIQAGQTAYDDASKAMDKDCKLARDILIKELKPLGFYCQKRANNNIKSQHNIWVGLSPDGGAWFDKSGKLVAVFEGKKQGIKGNAIERWCKNYMLATRINSEVRYVTFGRGLGFDTNNGCYKFAKTFMNPNQTFNVLYKDGQSWFINVDGFTREEIIDIMRRAITGNFT